MKLAVNVDPCSFRLRLATYIYFDMFSTDNVFSLITPNGVIIIEKNSPDQFETITVIH